MTMMMMANDDDDDDGGGGGGGGGGTGDNDDDDDEEEEEEEEAEEEGKEDDDGGDCSGDDYNWSALVLFQVLAVYENFHLTQVLCAVCPDSRTLITGGTSTVSQPVSQPASKSVS